MSYSYCIKCKNDTKSKNLEVSMLSGRPYLQSLCKDCGCHKSQFCSMSDIEKKMKGLGIKEDYSDEEESDEESEEEQVLPKLKRKREDSDDEESEEDDDQNYYDDDDLI